MPRNRPRRKKKKVRKRVFIISKSKKCFFLFNCKTKEGFMKGILDLSMLIIAPQLEAKQKTFSQIKREIVRDSNKRVKNLNPKKDSKEKIAHEKSFNSCAKNSYTRKSLLKCVKARMAYLDKEKIKLNAKKKKIEAKKRALEKKKRNLFVKSRAKALKTARSSKYASPKYVKCLEAAKEIPSLKKCMDEEIKVQRKKQETLRKLQKKVNKTSN